MILEFVWVGATRNSHWKALEEDYLDRICRHLTASVATIRESRKSDRHQVAGHLKREEQLLKQRFKQGDYVVCLAPRGQQLSSSGFAKFLGRLQNTGKRRVCWVVGGPLGLSREFQEGADFRLSLGKMTFPHEMARVLLLEQVFRALCLSKGIPYAR